ncbi:hypothetical protein KP79_PYT06866 [Mizuhopecten yessoensis]|uniref:Uncharacterized protein n=1 Tax=Mizuhopecten yessoensis TaxID=6573 RepID=A0A210QUU2_MIZYE|nr:hypothetical protein KP79_PYT06866 [Mizuhopecten yessoensis]
MDSVMTGNTTDRINNALAALRSEMFDLRQQDGQLMKQLICINENIKTLSKRPIPARPIRKRMSLVKGRRKFINPNESIPEEDSSSADSDSDDSVSGTENYQ